MSYEDGAYGIQPVPSSTPGALTCGVCGRSWADDITPAGRCPWEDQHSEPQPDPIVASLLAIRAQLAQHDARGKYDINAERDRSNIVDSVRALFVCVPAIVADIDAVLAEIVDSEQANDLEPVLDARDAASNLLHRIRTTLTEGTTL